MAASLEDGQLVKNSFTVHYEECLKSPMFLGRSFADSRRKFIALLRGKFQQAIHGRDTPLSEEAQAGNLLLNPKGRFKVFAEFNGAITRTERELLLALVYDREIDVRMICVARELCLQCSDSIEYLKRRRLEA